MKNREKKVKSISNGTGPWPDQKDFASSATADHVANKNHVTNWSDTKILDRESHRKPRQLKESICIMYMERIQLHQHRLGSLQSLTIYNHTLVMRSSPNEVCRW